MDEIRSEDQTMDHRLESGQAQPGGGGWGVGLSGRSDQPGRCANERCALCDNLLARFGVKRGVGLLQVYDVGTLLS